MMIEWRATCPVELRCSTRKRRGPSGIVRHARTSWMRWSFRTSACATNAHVNAPNTRITIRRCMRDSFPTWVVSGVDRVYTACVVSGLVSVWMWIASSKARPVGNRTHIILARQCNEGYHSSSLDCGRCVDHTSKPPGVPQKHTLKCASNQRAPAPQWQLVAEPRPNMPDKCRHRCTDNHGAAHATVQMGPVDRRTWTLGS